METLKVLPEVNARIKGGLASIGYDRVTQIRDEVSALEQLAAVVLGIPRETLTLADVNGFISQVTRQSDLMTTMTAQEKVLFLEPLMAAPADEGNRQAAIRTLLSTIIAASR